MAHWMDHWLLANLWEVEARARDQGIKLWRAPLPWTTGRFLRQRPAVAASCGPTGIVPLFLVAF
jgi:hypothetical protein